ncbi:MAG: hypothetical protein ACRCT8_12170 [Lacipirellulaceae bacterium]
MSGSVVGGHPLSRASARPAECSIGAALSSLGDLDVQILDALDVGEIG